MATRPPIAPQRLSIPSLGRLATRAAGPSYVVLAVMLAGMSAGVALTDFVFADAFLFVLLGWLGAFAAIGMLARSMRMARTGSTVETLAIFGAAALLTPQCAALLAATNLPLADPWLARADRMVFGLDRSLLVAWWGQTPGLMAATEAVYHSLTWQPAILLCLLFATGQADRAWHFLTAWLVTLAITVAIFPFVPATGGPPFFLDFVEPLHALRDGSLRTLGVDVLTGIVAFPSFHAAGAVLLGWGFARTRFVGPVAIVLNAAMFFSALIACHYLVDLLAGAAVALAAIGLSRRMLRGREDRTAAA